MRDRRWVVLVVAILVAAAAIVLAVRKDGAESAFGPVVTRAPLSSAANELLIVTNRRADLRFHARYHVLGSDPSVTVQEEAWLDGDRLRVSREAQAPDESLTRTATIVVSDQVAGCIQSPGEEWVCSPVPNRSSSDLRLFEEPTETELFSVSVESRDDKVGDEAVRCFSLNRSDAATEVCFTTDGIPARFVAGTTRRELVELTRGPVEAGIFDLPAPLT